jgi:hypothetical protein
MKRGQRYYRVDWLGGKEGEREISRRDAEAQRKDGLPLNFIFIAA